MLIEPHCNVMTRMRRVAAECRFLIAIVLLACATMPVRAEPPRLLPAHTVEANGKIPQPSTPIASPARGLEFIDTSFENASPLWYDFAPDGTINIHLLYDHERDSPNRAAGHFHFLL